MTRDVSERYRWEVPPVGFCYMDADLRYIEINEWLAAVHGIPVADHRGRKISDAIPDVTEQTLVCLRRVIETGKPVTNRIVSGKTPGDPIAKKLTGTIIALPGPARTRSLASVAWWRTFPNSPAQRRK